jgi:hypothetical protein
MIIAKPTAKSGKCMGISSLASLSEPATTTMLDICEFGLLLFALLVVIGVIGEHKLPWWNVKYELFSVLVAVGCAGEMIADGGVFIFSKHLQTISDAELSHARVDVANALLMADSANERAEVARKDAEGFRAQIAEATARAAIAEQHAAEANRIAESERLARVQLQKELQPRRLTARQKQTFAADLGSNPQPIFIGFCAFETDCIDFANDIGDGFKQAHWTPTLGPRMASPYGIVVGFMKGSDPILAKSWVDKVRQALATVELSSKQEWSARVNSFETLPRGIY